MLYGITGDQRFVIMLVGIVGLTAIVISTVAILMGVFNAIHRRSSEDQLKRDMLDRGMTAEEIETVIKATPPTDFLDRMADRKRRGV